jgi:hypothetical protein
MPIYFISYHATPLSSNSEFGSVKGAYINAWIDADDIVGAKKTVFKKMEDLDWKIISLEDAKKTSRDFFANNLEALEKYEQALADKEVYTIHTYHFEEGE